MNGGSRNVHTWAQAVPMEPFAVSQVVGLGPDCESGLLSSRSFSSPLLGPVIFPVADASAKPLTGGWEVGGEDWRAWGQGSRACSSSAALDILGY